MSCASCVEIEDVSQNAPCHLHAPISYGTECPSYEKVEEIPLNSAPAFALSKTYGMSCASSVEIEDFSHCLLYTSDAADE